MLELINPPRKKEIAKCTECLRVYVCDKSECIKENSSFVIQTEGIYRYIKCPHCGALLPSKTGYIVEVEA